MMDKTMYAILEMEKLMYPYKFIVNYGSKRFRFNMEDNSDIVFRNVCCNDVYDSTWVDIYFNNAEADWEGKLILEPALIDIETIDKVLYCGKEYVSKLYVDELEAIEGTTIDEKIKNAGFILEKETELSDGSITTYVEKITKTKVTLENGEYFEDHGIRIYRKHYVPDYLGREVDSFASILLSHLELFAEKYREIQKRYDKEESNE